MKKDIRAYGYEELQKEIATIGEKAFRAKQIYEWMHVKLVDHFDEMTNLSKALREKLEEIMRFSRLLCWRDRFPRLTVRTSSCSVFMMEM